MENIIKKSYNGELKYDGEVILKYNIEYPEIIRSRYRVGEVYFNSYNKKIADDTLKYVNTELYKEAKDTYKYNKENGYPIMVYELDMKYNITYNRNGIVSMYIDKYIFSGGAHGNTIRTSQTWNLLYARRLSLEEVYFSRNNIKYKNKCNYVIDILKKINMEIAKRLEENPGIYFDDYCTLVLETFNFENFYIDEKCIIIYFNQYDIAPYSTGIPTFCV